MNIAPQILSDALSLPPEERGELAYLLLESLPEDERPLELNSEYEGEILRRLEEIDRGQAKMVTLDEVMARLRRNSSISSP